MEKNKFYITTTLPYVNAPPHIGFALEIIQADVVARYHALNKEDVFFNTGTDEHGQKVYQGALAEGKTPQEYCDFYAAKFDDLKDKLNLSYNNFIRTTDEHHIKAAQEFWKRCEKNGDIYKANYKIKYCVGCELEKQESELVDGCCPLHPNRELEIREEENYFFKFSNYQDKLLRLYDDNPSFVIPAHRQKEIYNFVKEGLQDFSISRLAEKMSWGIPVPGDEKHVMYVWFDALINYVSCLGWPEDTKKFEEFWGTQDKPNATQVAGKDNLRQQSAMWQAMLMSAGLPNSKQIFIHGFINMGGQKVSKSSGIKLPGPIELVEKYGTDALRYYVLREIPSSGDGNFSEERFEIRYNELANSLGNLISRVTNLAEQEGLSTSSLSKKGVGSFVPVVFEGGEYHANLMNNYEFDVLLDWVFGNIKELNEYIDSEKPWAIVDKIEKTKVIRNSLFGAKNLLFGIKNVGIILAPFMPETSEKILKIFESEKIIKAEPLFPKKQ